MTDIDRFRQRWTNMDRKDKKYPVGSWDLKFLSRLTVGFFKKNQNKN